MLQRHNSIAAAWLVWLAFLFLSAGVVFGCSSAPPRYPRHELIDQILKPRRGFPGKLTNRACESWGAKGECTAYVILEYDLKNPLFRQTANDLGIICNIAGKRYKLCKDKEGFCRFERKSCGFLGLKSCLREIGFIDASNSELLLSSGTRCFNDYKYPFDVGTE